MLTFLRSKVTNRKLWLFTAVCCRRIWSQLKDQRSRAALEWLEQYADELISKDRMRSAYGAARDVTWKRDTLAARAACRAAELFDWGDIEGRVGEVCLLVARVRGGAHEARVQCHLLRHLIGNPFRPYPAPAHWPVTVIQLAEALYAGEDCAFALHDALLEAGHSELAAHFKEEQWHPKGCWVVDMILGKK
jgi:hypothetical protein